MKLKFHSKMFLAAMAATLIAVGCSKDDKTPVPDPVPVSFTLQVTDITPGQAAVTIKPSDQTVTYFFGAMVKTEFEAFASEASFLSTETKRIQALAEEQSMTLEAYLKANGKQGDKTVSVTTIVPQTLHYVYVYAIDDDGKASSKVFKTEFTSGDAPATAPVLELSMTPGDAQQFDKDIRMTISGKSAGVTSGKLLFVVKSELDAALAQGATLEQIINNNKNGYPFEPEELESLNSETGWKYSFSKLTPSTAYTVIVKVTNAIGSTIQSISESTLADAGSNGPTLDLSLVRGDKEGKNKTTNMAAAIKATGAMAGRYGLFSKTQVDAALEQGYTLSYLIENNGFAFTPEQLALVNDSKGYEFYIDQLEPNRAYTLIIKVASTGGTTIKMASETTTTGIGPNVNVAMVPGDKQGENTDVNMFITMKSSGVLSARQAFLPKADFDAAIAQGKTPAQLLDAHGETATTDELASMNSANGLERIFSTLLSETAYTHILEAESENGTSLDVNSALTSASDGPTSDLTFAFEIEDVGTKSANLSVIPSNNTEKYYFDYLPVSEYEKKTDAQHIATIIGVNGIAMPVLSSGIAGYDSVSFDYLPLTPGTDYYFYAFGYDPTTKSATTKLAKQKFTTQTGNDPATEAYNAWLGTWTVTSTSSEKNKTVVTFDITIEQKVVNASYLISGWGVTSYRTRWDITAALKSDGGLRIKNMQELGAAVAGTLTFVGRYFKPSTSGYAMATARIDALTGVLNADKQTATINGGTFTLEGDATVHTITAMDYYNHKDTGSWVGYTSLADYKESGNPVGPYTLTKTSNSPFRASGMTPRAKTPMTDKQKVILAKRTLAEQKIAPVLKEGNKGTATPALVKTRSIATLNLSDTDDQSIRSLTKKLVLSK